jgi:hypothetical protein
VTEILSGFKAPNMLKLYLNLKQLAVESYKAHSIGRSQFGARVRGIT